MFLLIYIKHLSATQLIGNGLTQISLKVPIWTAEKDLVKMFWHPFERRKVPINISDSINIL
jgi:hypothetical protein